MRYEVLFNKKHLKGIHKGTPDFTPIQSMYHLAKFKIGSSDPTGLSSKSVINIKTGSSGGMTVTVQRSNLITDAVSSVFYLALPDSIRRLKGPGYLGAALQFDMPNFYNTRVVNYRGRPMETRVHSPGSFAVGLNFKNGNHMDDAADIRFGPACRFRNLTGLSLSFVNLSSNSPAFPQRTYSEYESSGTIFTLQASLYRTPSTATGFGALRIDDAVFWYGSLVEKQDKIWPAGSKLPSVVGFALVHHKDNAGDPLAEHAIASVRFRRFILDYHPL